MDYILCCTHVIQRDLPVAPGFSSGEQSWSNLPLSHRYQGVEAEAATEGQTLSGPPCHALREKPEEDNESTGMKLSGQEFG